MARLDGQLIVIQEALEKKFGEGEITWLDKSDIISGIFVPNEDNRYYLDSGYLFCMNTNYCKGLDDLNGLLYVDLRMAKTEHVI